MVTHIAAQYQHKVVYSGLSVPFVGDTLRDALKARVSFVY